MTFNHDRFVFKHPFSMMVIGSTSSGKSQFVRSFLTEFKIHTSYNSSVPLKCLWCYAMPESLRAVPGLDVITQQGIPSEETLRDLRVNIVVLDDLANEISMDKTASNLFTRISHHLNVTFIFNTQHAFTKGLNLISNNCHVFVFMKSPRSLQQLDSFVRQTSLNRNKVRDAYIKATEQPFSYLLCDLSPHSEDQLRVRSRILSSELPDNLKSYGSVPIIWM